MVPAACLTSFASRRDGVVFPYCGGAAGLFGMTRQCWPLPAKRKNHPRRMRERSQTACHGRVADEGVRCVCFAFHRHFLVALQKCRDNFRRARQAVLRFKLNSVGLKSLMGSYAIKGGGDKMNRYEDHFQFVQRRGRLHDAIMPGLLCLILLWSNPATADQNKRDHEESADKHSSQMQKRSGHEQRHHRDRQQARNTTGKLNETTIVSTVGITDVSVDEGNAGTTRMVFTLTLSAPANDGASVQYAISDGTSRAGSDYTPMSGTLDIPQGSVSAAITVFVHGDTVPEPIETLTVTISSPTGNLVLGTASASGMIIDDDQTSLNDTGITSWGDAISNVHTVAQSAFPGQDAEFGRDVDPALSGNADGRAGYSYTKLDSSGVPLIDQTAIYSNTPWDCVQDNVTGLMWEVKTPAGSGGLRDAFYEYTWYNSNVAENGGFAGGANGGFCADALNCDTEKYVAAVNAAALCGYSDWRMPKKEEFRSIKDYSFSTSGFALDTNYFPNTMMSWYWTATPYAYDPNLVWGIGFYYADPSGLGYKVWIDHVRLVRGGK